MLRLTDICVSAFPQPGRKQGWRCLYSQAIVRNVSKTQYHCLDASTKTIDSEMLHFLCVRHFPLFPTTIPSRSVMEGHSVSNIHPLRLPSLYLTLFSETDPTITMSIWRSIVYFFFDLLVGILAFIGNICLAVIAIPLPPLAGE